MDNNKKSIMIVGVGGQGTLLASRLVGNLLMDFGYDVKVSEVHGMAQRGGSVVTYVKYGDHVYSPVINEGEADVVLAFERLEAARWLSCLREGGTLLVNDQRIDPMPVITGTAEYPDGILEEIQKAGIHMIAADLLSLANEAGSTKAVNVVMIGMLSGLLPFEEAAWKKVIRETVPEKFLSFNLKAFELGRNLTVKGVAYAKDLGTN